jgi:hypothetical protein
MHQFSEKESAQTAEMALNQIKYTLKTAKRKLCQNFHIPDTFLRKLLQDSFLDAF